MKTPLWWGALRSRLLPNLLLLALSSVAVLTAVLGPVLVRAIEQVTVTDTLAQAGVKGTSITVTVNGDAKEDVGPLESSVETVLAPAASGPASGLWLPPQTWVETIENVAWSPGDQVGPGEQSSRVQVSADDCAGLVITSGTCPVQSGQVLVSASDAATYGVKVGSVLEYRLENVRGAQLSVVGTYDSDRVSHPVTRPGTADGDVAAVTGDPLLVTPAELTNLPLATQVSSRLVLRGSPTLADEALLRQTVNDVTDSSLAQDLSIAVATALPDTLDHVDQQRTAASVLIGVSEAQSLALAAFALAVVLQRIGRARSAEWGIGRLLGVPRRRWLGSVYVEPGIALLLGLPVGLAAGALVGRLAISAGLGRSTPLELFRWPVLVAAVAATLVALLALVAVSLPSLRRPLAELIQERSEPTKITPVGAVAQATAVLLAAATLYTLLAGGVLDARGSQLGLLAPALFALALAVIAVRVAVLVVRRVTVRPARRLGALVVGRQAARTPSALTPAIVVAVGVALAIFATQVLAVSSRNQLLRADATTGAATVLHVSAPRTTDLTAVVRAADPTGRYAMAVQERAREIDLDTGRIVAVDSSRLAAVSTWQPGWSGVADLAAALHPSQVAPIRLTGSRVEVDLGSVSVAPGKPLSADTAPAQPHLKMVVDNGATWLTVDLGVPSSSAKLSAALACTRGCRLVAIGMESESLAPYDARAVVAGIGTDHQPVSASTTWLRQPNGWHVRVGSYYDPDSPDTAEASDDANGLLLRVSDSNGGGFPSVAPADVTDPLPAVLAPRTGLQPFAGIPDAAFGVGLDGNPQLLTVVGRASVLPRALGDGVLVDLPEAAALINPQNDSSSDEVWLAPGAPSSVEQALVAAGLKVTGRELLSDEQATQLREPTTRGAAVAVTLAYASLALTLLALVSARIADARRRRGDWRSLADAGVRTRTVRRLVATEIGVPALLGVALGTISGLTALVLAAPRLPLVDLSTAGPPLDLRISWLRAAILAVASAVVVVVVAVVGGRLETGGRRRD